jgi:hypothetical protein
MTFDDAVERLIVDKVDDLDKSYMAYLPYLSDNRHFEGPDEHRGVRNLLTRISRRRSESAHRGDGWGKHRRESALVALLLIVVLAPLVYLTLIKPRIATAGWWPNGGNLWEKRKQLTLTNDSTEDLAANTTVAVTIDTQTLVNNGQLQDDCDDLRILYQPDSSTFTELARNIVPADGGTCATSEATKVNFPLQAALTAGSSTTYYYLYYSNSAASTPSNTVDAYDIGSTNALLVCPFDGSTDCVNSNGTEQPTTESGAIRYGGQKGALSFDGVNDQVSFTSSSFAQMTSNFTYETWFKLDKYNTNMQVIIGMGLGYWADIDILESDDPWDPNRIIVELTYSDWSNDTLYGPTAQLDTWYHVALSVDTTTARLFVNGTLQDSVSIVGKTIGASEQPFYISHGGGAGGGPYRLHGLADEARVSDVARYTSNFTPQTTPFVRDEHTKLLLHFDEAGDDPRNTGKAIDDSGNGNDGTITGAKYVTGLVGVDKSANDEGYQESQSFAGHNGIFLEEYKTNLVTNPSFEHSTYNTNWTASGGTPSENTTAPYYKFGSKSYQMVLSDGTDVNIYTSINTGNTDSHALSAYVYRGTSGNVGGTVDNTVAQLYFNGAAQSSTTYTDMGGGWWRLSYIAASGSGSQDYGVTVVEDSGTLYIDGVQLERKNIYDSTAYMTTYIDGSLGTGYSWSGTANESTSTRSGAYLAFSPTNNVSDTNGSISMWIKLNSIGYAPVLFRWEHDSDNNYVLTCNSGTCGFYKTVTGTQYSTGTVGSTTDLWAHVVATWSNSSGIAFYVNSTPASTDSNTGVPSGLSNDNFTIGYNDPLFEPNGFISDVRIYDSALSAAEVADLYQAGLVAHSEDIVVDRFDDNKGQNPVAVWHFDEGYGSTAYDSSTYDNHLTINNASFVVPQSQEKSPPGKYLQFDSTTDYLSRTADTDFNFGTDSFTIGGYFRHSSTAPASGYDTIISRYGSAGWRVYMDTNGYLCFGIDDDSSWNPADTDTSCSTESYADSKWHYFEAIKSSTSYIDLYIDGHSVDNESSLTETGTLNSSATLYVGNDSTSSDNYWDGFLDEIIIYPYARSADQVKTDLPPGFSQVSASFGSDEDSLTEGLVGWWKMDESSGNASDSSGNNVTGTNSGGSWTNGKFGNGLNFDTNTDDVSLTTNHMDSTIGTISLWYKPASAYNTDALWEIFGVGTGSSSNDFYLQKTNAAGSYNLYWGINAGSDEYLTITPSEYSTYWTAGQWMHFTVTYDIPSRQLALYINDTLIQQNTVSGWTTWTPPSTWYIGNSSASDSYYANGAIDDFRVYNRALSPREVTQLYHYGPPPVAYWNMDLNHRAPSTSADMLAYYGGGSASIPETRQHEANWASEVTAQDLSETIEYQKMAANPSATSDEKILCSKTTSDHIHCQVWDGSSWGNLTSVIAAGQTTTSEEGFSVAYEQVSGTGMVCYRDTTDDSIPYCDTWDGSSWSSKSANAADVSSTVSMFKLIPEPGSDYIALMTKDAADDVNVQIWNGSSWGNLNEVEGTACSSNGTDCFDGAWDTKGNFMATWYDITAHEVQSLVYNKSTGWGSEQTGVITANIDSGATVWMNLAAHPFSGEMIVVATDDDVTSPTVEAAYWNGSSWGSRTTLEDNLGAGQVDSSTFPLDVAYEHAGDYDALATYGAVSNALKYRIWDTATQQWGNEQSFSTPGDDTDTDWQLLTPDLYSDRIMFTLQGDTNDVNTIEWQGDAWEPSFTSQETSGNDSQWNAWFVYDNQPDAVVDISGNGKAGRMELTMTEADWVPGKFGSAMNFDGSDDYVDLGTTSTLQPSNLTFTAWVKRTVPWSGYQGDFFTTKVGAWDNNGWYVDWYDPSGTDNETLNLVVDGGNYFYVTGDPDVYYPLNEWVFIAATFDSTTNEGKIYKNGVQQSVSTYGSPDSITATAANKYIDRGWEPTENRAKQIDEVRIYNYARTQEQIIEDMNASHPVGGSPVGSQVGYWKFDEGYGDTAYDSSPQGNDGDLAGSGTTCPLAGDNACGDWTTGGKFGNAYEFSIVGSTFDYIDLGNDSSLLPENEISISGWIKTNYSYNTNYHAIAGNYTSGSDNGYIVALGTTSVCNNSLVWYVDTSDANGANLCASTTINDNNWHHFTVTYKNGSGEKIYVDGKLENSNTTPSGTIVNSNNTVYLGAYGDLIVSSGLDGKLDEVKIYNVALTPDQVKLEYNQGKTAVLGSLSTTSDGTSPSFSAQREFCPPGNTEGNCGGSNDPSPVGWWKMDENTGTTTTYDHSGNSYDASMDSFSSADWVPGKFGSSLYFDQTNNYLDVPSENGDFSINNYSISTWIYHTADSIYDETVVSNEDANIDGWKVWVEGSAEKIECFYNSTYAQSTTSISLNTWYHIACVSDGSNIKTYINGVEEGSSGISGSISETTDLALSGNSYDGYSGYFTGRIDDVRFYNYARTPAQIAWDYNRGAPIAWWKLDECTGTTAYDSSVNGNGDANGNDGVINIGSSGDNSSAGTCSSGNSNEAWNNGTSGKRGASLDLDGTDDYISAGDVLNLGTNDFSVSFWTKSSLTTDGTIIEKMWDAFSSDGGEGWAIWLDSAGNFSLAIGDSQGVPFTTINSNDNNYNDGQWHSVVLTADRNGDATFYIDGVNQGGGDISSESSDLEDESTNPLLIGINYNKGATKDRPFDGQIDDVRIYNYELTAQQIEMIMNNGAANFGG